MENIRNTIYISYQGFLIAEIDFFQLNIYNLYIGDVKVSLYEHNLYVGDVKVSLYEHNLYIGDVKVSPEGRCLELLQ